MEETEHFLASYIKLKFEIQLYCSLTNGFRKGKKLNTALRSQERPPSILRGHGGDGALPGKLEPEFGNTALFEPI